MQAKVDAILAKYKAQIVAAVPGASVQYRGSLASGWKGPHKLSADGSALRFDPTSFDCDAFIEVPSATWTGWADQGIVSKDPPFLVKLDLFQGPGAAQLRGIQAAIARDLGAQVPGYKKVRGVGDFKFRLQSTAESAHQMKEPCEKSSSVA